MRRCCTPMSFGPGGIMVEVAKKEETQVRGRQVDVSGGGGEDEDEDDR